MKRMLVMAAVPLLLAGCTPAVTEEPPAFVKELIAGIEAAPAANSPGAIWQYRYGERTVYYLPPSCCDVPSALFDADGELICGPDGGFTGKGDGRCPDFFDRRSKERKIWDDPRVE
jgi:hypothetical protein